MTAKQLFLKIEDKLHEAMALCDIVGAAASSDGFDLNSESVSRVMAIAVLDLHEVLEICTSETEEKSEEGR